jgi:hypothetical protein
MDLIRSVYMNRFSVENMFDEFIRQATRFYERPAHSMQELKARQNTKARGDIFEEFCATYLRRVCRYEDVWLLADAPDATLELLGMKRRDMGIDIVVHDSGSFYAVQCKYKKRAEHGVGWKELSTFYALCMRTGPWSRHIVMTNCRCVRHQGRRTIADASICLSSLRALTSDQWGSMAQADVPTSPALPPEALTPEELRKRRLVHFSQS